MILKTIENFIFPREKIFFSLSGNAHKGFFPVESNKVGYWIEDIESSLIIKRVDPFAVTIGFPALYYFRGERIDGLVRGEILVRDFIRYFMFLWFGLVFIAWLVGAAFLIFLSLDIFQSTLPNREVWLTSFVLIVGPIIVGGFGLSVTFLIRLIYGSQRKKLITFCKNISLALQ